MIASWLSQAKEDDSSVPAADLDHRLHDRLEPALRLRRLPGWLAHPVAHRPYEAGQLLGHRHHRLLTADPSGQVPVAMVQPFLSLGGHLDEIGRRPVVALLKRSSRLRLVRALCAACMNTWRRLLLPVLVIGPRYCFSPLGCPEAVNPAKFMDAPALASVEVAHLG